MLAEIKDPALSANDDQKPGTAQVDITVIVDMATDPPTFTYRFDYEGKHTARSVWVENEFADFTLTLQPENLPPDSQMTFVPFGSDGSGPITWLYPGTKTQRPQPDFIIAGPELTDPMTLEFTVQNDATVDKDVLVSFSLNVVLIAPDGPPTYYTSPDPTIINVDPTGGPNDGGD